MYNEGFHYGYLVDNNGGYVEHMREGKNTLTKLQ